MKKFLIALLAVLGFTAATVVVPQVAAADPITPSIGCHIRDYRTDPDNGKCGVWGGDGYVKVYVQCTNVAPNTSGIPRAPKAQYSTLWTWFGGGYSSYSPKYYVNWCTSAYPYIVGVTGAASNT